MENVKGLLIHDKGKTIQTILKVLREDLDYYVPEPQIVNAMNFGVPQHRERVYIVGFRKDQNVNEFTYPTPTDTTKTFADIKEKNTVSAKYYLSTQYVKTLVAHKERHAAKGNGFGYEIIPDNGVANAIVVGGMGRERNLVIDNRLEDFTPVTNIKGEINRDGLRRMTPREWARLQGFPDNFIIGVADASAYKQFGNSVAVPAIQATAQEIIKRINLSKSKNMALTGNKGEWSEIYTLLKLLGEGKVYAGDQHMNKIHDLFYPIIMILRQEKEGNFNYKLQDRDVVIQTPEGEELLRIPASVFLVEAENLLKAINENDGAFTVPKIEAFMNRIYCHALKAKSSDKTDIRIILHDRRTKINSEMGFSIKSQLGGDSTLLNASKATNFNFKIEGTSLSDEDIAKINSLNPTRNKVIERYKAITKKGCKLIFDKVDNSTFRNNLIMLDGDLPSIIANLLLEQLNSGVSTLKELVEQITETNPLGYDTEQASPFYAYKIKHLLTSAALGMMPATAWSGKFDANGGYLVVKKDGEILCYHFYDRNRFEDYLFSNAYLERSSTSRHEYASIIKENDGTLSFKLNFQVRLK